RDRVVGAGREHRGGAALEHDRDAILGGAAREAYGEHLAGELAVADDHVAATKCEHLRAVRARGDLEDPARGLPAEAIQQADQLAAAERLAERFIGTHALEYREPVRGEPVFGYAGTDRSGPVPDHMKP